MLARITPERERYHAIIPLLYGLLKTDEKQLIYDVGKHRIHDYREMFPGCRLLTVDIDAGMKPNIVLNVEEFPEGIQDGSEKAWQPGDAILCNGVTERCENPYHLARGVNRMLKMGGFALFGIMGAGYPSHQVQRALFAPAGASDLVSQHGFDIIRESVCYRNVVPSYTYLIATKVAEC